MPPPNAPPPVTPSTDLGDAAAAAAFRLVAKRRVERLGTSTPAHDNVVATLLALAEVADEMAKRAADYDAKGPPPPLSPLVATFDTANRFRLAAHGDELVTLRDAGIPKRLSRLEALNLAAYVCAIAGFTGADLDAAIERLG